MLKNVREPDFDTLRILECQAAGRSSCEFMKFKVITSKYNSGLLEHVKFEISLTNKHDL